MTRLYAANLVLFGALVGVLVSSACNQGGLAWAVDGPVSVILDGVTAGIDPVPVTPYCTSWEIQLYAFGANCDDETCTPPEGWEPFASYDSMYMTWLRRCAD